MGFPMHMDEFWAVKVDGVFGILIRQQRGIARGTWKAVLGFKRGITRWSVQFHRDIAPESQSRDGPVRDAMDTASLEAGVPELNACIEAQQR